VLTRFLAEWRGLNRAELDGSCFYRVGGDAVRHLFRVASGLDSLALGESEVLGQVRQALSLARESGSTRAVMQRLFESAVAAGKRVRAETEIARHPLSVASIGFELARKVFGDLSRRRVLVIGAGETGSLFARHAVEAGVREPVIVNRTESRARELAASLGGRAVPWSGLAGAVPLADVVVSATASPQHVVTRDQVEAAMRERRGRPMLFLDLAVPRDIAPDVTQVYNVFAYSIDDLEEVADDNRARRAQEVPMAEKIVDEEMAREPLGRADGDAVAPPPGGAAGPGARARAGGRARAPARPPRRLLGEDPARADAPHEGGAGCRPQARPRRSGAPSLRFR